MFKKISLILLSIALVVSAGVSVLFGFNTNTANADGEAITEFSAVTGASVRVSDRSGIRFTVNVPTSVYDSVVSGGAYVNDSQIGMIIVPYAYVTDYNAYKASNPTSDYGYYEYFKNVKGKMINLSYTPEQVAANPVSGGYQIKGSLVDIKEANLERDFVGIGYVRTSGRYTYTAITEDDNARNITEIATKAIEDNSGKVSASQRGLLSSLYGIDYYTVNYENIDLSDEYYVNNAYGTNYALPADIIAEGYNFKGCTATANGEEYTVTGGKLDRDITVTGNWTADIAEGDIPYDIDKGATVQKIAHAWTADEAADADGRGGSYANITYSYSQDGKPTGKWAFDWAGRLKGSGTSYAGVKIPLIKYSDYSSVYFYVYCNWGTRLIKTGDSSWYDKYTVGTIGNTGDTYEQYGIITVKDGKLYFRLNSDKTDTEIWNLTSTILGGTENLVISFKDGGGRNIRDEGGWTTESGNKVKYGLLYRGAQLNGYKNGAKLTEEGIKTFRDALGIKTELDLRGTNDSAGQTECYFGSDRNYRMISISQYDRALSGSKNQIKEIFDLLADESNYPVYFHCNAGADRTGTIAFLLNGLLGVSERDLTKDFELTSFGGQGKRLRSKDTGSGYDDSGVYQDDSSNYVAWGRLVDYIKKNYVKGEVTTLSEGIEKYLLGIGVSQNDLNKIKALMLGLKEKADDRSAEATCEKGGVKVYELNGKDFTVETPAFGHDFVVEGGKAICKNCELSGDYVHIDADSSSAVVFSEELSLSGVKVTDKFGSDAGTRVSFTKSDASDEERIYIVKTADKTVITGVAVWSKIIKTADDLKNANAYTTTNVAMKTIKGYFLIGEDITLGEKWKETYSIGYNTSGYTFTGVIDGNGKTLSGLDTESRAGLVYAFSGEIRDFTVKGEAAADNSQFLCASSYGGKIFNVKLEVLLGEKPIETANSAVLGNIGENGEISELYLENVTVIETSATEKKANRKKSSALGKMYNKTDKSKLFINGLTVVGVRPLLTATFDDSDVAGEVTLKSFLGENVQNVKVYNTIASYKAA